jgi:hypothetical protein
MAVRHVSRPQDTRVRATYGLEEVRIVVDREVMLLFVMGAQDIKSELIVHGFGV